MAKRRGILRDVQAGLVEIVNLAAATQTVTRKQTNEIFIGVVDGVFTLPAIDTTLSGIRYTFVTGVASAVTGLRVTPAAADNIFGGGLTAVDGESLTNTAATDVLGDQVTLVCDGVNWLITQLIGTWAKA